MPFSVVSDHFKVLKNGNIAGSVFRVLADEPVPIYDSPNKGAQIMCRVKPGSLLVAFSDPGELRQVNTADQFFGYMPRSVILLPVAGIDPEGLYDPETRATVQSSLPPIEEMRNAYTAEQTRIKHNQYYFMMGFILILLLGLLSVFLHSPAAANVTAVPVK